MSRTVWVGWDEREQKTYEACKNSIARRANNILVRPLKQHSLRRDGLYYRSPDAASSTSFSLTRFLVPALQNFDGWALFCDCDFVFTKSLHELFDLADPTKAVQVVKHGPDLWYGAHGTDEYSEKMDGKKQSYYPCKWWSALVLFNCSHMANRTLSVGAVNRQSPSWLHRFAWLTDEKLIGELPSEWHWLDGYSHPTSVTPAGVHYTRGSPELAGWENTRYAELWRKELT